MLTRPVNKDDALEDFAAREITLNGIAKKCLCREAGRR